MVLCVIESCPKILYLKSDQLVFRHAAIYAHVIASFAIMIMTSTDFPH